MPNCSLSRPTYSVIHNFINTTRISSSPIYLITLGFVSILGQVVILRELNVAFFGIELIYILSLGFWLLGTAMGSGFGRRAYLPAERKVQTLFLITTIVFIMDIAFVRGVRKIFGGVAGGYLPFELQIIGLMIAILPLSILAGLLFQWIAKIFMAENRTLAQAYSLESIGGVLGGLLSTLLLASGLQNLSAGLTCAMSSFGVVFCYSWKEKFILQKYLSGACIAIILLLFGFGNQIDRWMTSWNHPHLIESRDTPYSRVTVTSLEEQVNIFENDALSYETETNAAEEFVQLSSLQATKLGKVLVLGGGFEGIISELLKLPVRGIDYVEINRGIIKVIRNRLPPEVSGSLKDERVKIFYEDPRRFLNQAHSYDAIMVVMPEPTSAESNRFYTEDFFEQCSRRLNQDGIFAFRIPSAENFWTTNLQNRNRSIFAALKFAFSKVVVIPGVTDIFIASGSALATDPAVLIDRFNSRNIKTKLVIPAYIKYVYTNDRFRELEKILSTRTSVPNSDIRPACYSYTISIWLSKFFGEFTLPDASSFQISRVAGSPIFWFAILVAAIFAVNRRLFALRRFVLMSLTGFAGMLSEALLILNYQDKNGVLYQDIGILLMSFMVGLALGAMIVDRFFQTSASIQRKHLFLGVMLILGFALLNFVIYYAIRFDFVGAIVCTSLMLVSDGFFVSAIFAFVSLNKNENRGKAMTWLYSADLIGGSLGSLTASLVLLPVFGILTASIISAAVAICALAFLG